METSLQAEAPTTAVATSTGVDLGSLFDRHAPQLLRLVERIAGRGQHVEDIVQDVFLTAQRKVAELGACDDPRAWLYGAAIHLVRHHRRSIARTLRVVARFAVEDSAPRPAQADDLLLRLENAARVRACVGKLPAKQREVFVLYELEELEGAIIARVLGIPENTVWSRLLHARRRFEKIWSAAAREARS